jgi:uncharacterized membrane protein
MHACRKDTKYPFMIGGEKMISKKLTIAVIISTVVLITGILVPGLLVATDNDSPSVTRLYADSLEGPWSTTSSPTTR